MNAKAMVGSVLMLLFLTLGFYTSCSTEEDDSTEKTLLAAYVLANNLVYKDSCNYTSGYCQDSYGFGGGEANCSGSGKTYQTSKCSTASVIGSCKILQTNGFTSSGFILLFYTGFATPSSTCSGFGGTYSASIQSF